VHKKPIPYKRMGLHTRSSFHSQVCQRQVCQKEEKVTHAEGDRDRKAGAERLLILAVCCITLLLILLVIPLDIVAIRTGDVATVLPLCEECLVVFLALLAVIVLAVAGTRGVSIFMKGLSKG
jgi:hypothetical protein